jgi:hypothetical protein
MPQVTPYHRMPIWEYRKYTRVTITDDGDVIIETPEDGGNVIVDDQRPGRPKPMIRQRLRQETEQTKNKTNEKELF